MLVWSTPTFSTLAWVEVSPGLSSRLPSPHIGRWLGHRHHIVLWAIQWLADGCRILWLDKVLWTIIRHLTAVLWAEILVWAVSRLAKRYHVIRLAKILRPVILWTDILG